MAAKRDEAGQIVSGVVYRLDAFLRAAGWSQHAFRTAKRAGLRVVHTGGRCYVAGSAFLQYLDEQGRKESEKASAAQV